MSWDIVLFNSSKKIENLEEVDLAKLEPTDFCAVLESHFDEIVKDDDHREIKGKDFAINFFIDNELVSNKMLSLYGENGLFELVVLAKKHNWQIFDTGLGQMINLENPSINGYENFQNYLKHILKKNE
jgi:hypothetical protein